MDEIVKLIKNIENSEQSDVLHKNEDWKKILKLITPETNNEKYRIQYFIEKFIEINLEYPFLDIDNLNALFYRYDSSCKNHDYINDSASLMIKSNFDDLKNIISYNFSEDTDYYKSLFMAYILDLKEFTRDIKFSEEKFEKIMENIYNERFFYAFYVYSRLGIEIPENYLKRLLISDDSSAPEVFLMYYKFYPTKIQGDKCVEAMEKIGNKSYRYYFNSIHILKSLVRNEFDLLDMIEEESFDSPKDPQLIAGLFSDPSFDSYFQKFLTRISKKPDEVDRFYQILYEMLKIKNSQVKWSNQKLTLIKKAFENSDDNYHHYALIYGTLVRNKEDKEFLLEKLEEDDSYRLPYFLLAFSNCGAFPESLLEMKKTIYNSEISKLFVLIQSLWKKEKMVILETLLRGIKSQFNDDDNLLYYVCEILFIHNHRRVPPFGRLIIFLEDRQKFYPLNQLKKMAKYYSNLINSISMANIINNSDDFNRSVDDNLVSDKFSRLCLLLSLTKKEESGYILEGSCSYLSNINPFIYFFSSYNPSTSLLKMSHKILTLNTNERYTLNELESTLFLAVSFFQKDDTYPIDRALRYLVLHPSVAQDLIVYLLRQNRDLLFKLLNSEESDIATQIQKFKNGIYGLSNFSVPNIIRYLGELGREGDVSNLINFTLSMDPYHGISHLNSAGNVNVFDNENYFKLFMQSPYLKDDIKFKIAKNFILSEQISSYNFSSFKYFFEKFYDEEVHTFIVEMIDYLQKDESSISDSLFKALYLYENKNSSFQYLSLSGDRSVLKDIHELEMVKSLSPFDMEKMVTLKKILDEYEDDTPLKYYKSSFSSETSEKYKGRKILIQTFNPEENSHGSLLERSIFLALFAGLTVDYVDEDTSAIIATVTDDPSDEMFHALFNDEDKLNKILICKWN